MDKGLLPRRYAKALYKFADTESRQKSVYEMMANIARAFDSDCRLQQTMTNPFVDNDTKRDLLFSAAGVDAQETTLADFFKLLVTNGRVDIVRDIALAYLTLYRKANNIYSVKIESAAKLTPSDASRLTDIIDKHLDGASAEYSYDVNPDLIGGFVVTIDSERLDASVKNELKQLRLKLIK
jgi:F-type H+-transporting ATPase subunit delta